MLAGQTLEGRIRTLAQFQDQAGYMAEYEALPDQGFVIREHNCAICKVARRFPQACQKELEMFCFFAQFLAFPFEFDDLSDLLKNDNDKACRFSYASVNRESKLCRHVE